MRTWLQRRLAAWGFVCPKTGRFRKSRPLKGAAMLLFPVAGFLALLWYVIRVAEKPSRASYPCMQAAAPLASGFIVWLAGLIVLPAVFVKIWSAIKRRGLPVAGFALVALSLSVGGSVMFCRSGEGAVANAVIEGPNRPTGAAQGIFPGRVVWVWNPEATNERVTNRPGDGWFLPKNNNQPAIDLMLSEGLRHLTGADTDAAAWKAVFAFYNSRRGAAAGYVTGQKIFIKTNATSAWWGNFKAADLSIAENQFYGVAETNPAVVLSVLRQLVNTVGVAQTDIYVGDPMKHIYRHAYELWHAEFPGVHYIDHDFGPELGREKVTYTAKPAIFYSDRGTVMKAGGMNHSTSGPPVMSDTLCTLFETAEYIINIPTLKGHKRAGVTMFAKNHFGSHGRADASHLHGGLVNPDENNPRRQGYGLYRVQVDLMGHAWLGGKNLLYLMDALYAGPEAVYRPTKWRSVPFNNDWTSSLFLSLDPVAIESVGYDFLRTEYSAATEYDWVQMNGVDDYLHQAADRSAWPAGVVYDPEQDGTPVLSLGVHEHWNNAQDKRYSRNLGKGTGIELVRAGKGFGDS
jgi:hypothetical protein